MRIIKDILGGALIILAAWAIAVAQNAVRSDGIPLVPRVSTPDVGKREAAASSSADSGLTAGEAAEKSPLGAGSSGAVSAEEAASGQMARDRVKRLLDAGAIVLVDARPAREYQAGHIAGAISVPYENFADYYSDLTATVPHGSVIVCYCQSETCDDSENLARELRFMGYERVLLYKGGWDEWSAAGYPTAVPEASQEQDKTP
jgi:rhodanese-related sulfurtransferase